jgi:O-antigen/teichoic acid export membrane protein
MTESGAALSTRPTRSVGRNFAALLVSQSFTWVLATIVLALQPRFLGPTGQGQMRLSSSIWAIVGALAAFGTSTWTIVEVAKRPALTATFAANVLRLRLTLFAVAVPLTAAFVAVAGYSSDTVLIIAVSGVGTAMILAADTFSVSMHGLQEMGNVARADMASKLAVTLVVVVVLLLGGQALQLAFVTIGFGALWFTLILRGYRKLRPSFSGLVDDGPPVPAGRALMAVALPFLFADASLIIYQQVDTIAMSLLVDEEAIGWYGAADVLFGSLLFVPVLLMTSLFPKIAELHEREPATVMTLLERTFRSLLLVAVLIGVTTIVVAQPFVDLLYGPKFEQSGPVLEVFGVVVVLSCLTILLGRFALATGRVRFWTMLLLGAAAATIALDVVLVPWTDDRFANGALGGALAYIVTESVMLVVGLVKLAPGLFTLRTATRVAKIAVAGTIAAVVAWPLRVHFFLLPAVVTGVLYLVVLAVLRGFDPDERNQIRRVIARLRKQPHEEGR